MLLAERFGWSLEYIDAMSDEDLHQVLGVLDGKGKAQADIAKRGR